MANNGRSGGNGGRSGGNGGARSNHPMYRDQKGARSQQQRGAAYQQDDDNDSPQHARSDYKAMNVQQLERRRDDEFARQDEMLDQIHRGVKGLKNNAHAINNEVVEQNAMIDDLNDRMDDAQGDLERGEKKAREVNSKKAKVCKLYGLIAGLVIVEILLTVPFGLPFF